MPWRNADHYRRRAEELRAVAESMEDMQARESLLDLARQYEELAERVKKPGRQPFKPPA